MTKHDKRLGRAKKLCLALSKTHTCSYNLFTVVFAKVIRFDMEYLLHDNMDIDATLNVIM